MPRQARRSCCSGPRRSLAPDIWGPPGERLARFGFFDDPEDPGRPLPLGLGWVLDPVRGDSGNRDTHSVTLTCAACHVGRVRVAPDRYVLLVGAPNTEIDVRKFRRAAELTVDRLLSSEETLKRTVGRLIEIIKSKPEGYFFGGRYGIDAQAEAREREHFRDPAVLAKVLVDFAGRVKGGRATVEKQLRTSYSRPNAPPLDGGSPGQSDGSGDLIPKFLLGREFASNATGDPIQRFLATNYPEMPYRNATVTDNPSVWRQVDRPFGQLDGSIRAPIIRNIAAQTAVVGTPGGSTSRTPTSWRGSPPTYRRPLTNSPSTWCGHAAATRSSAKTARAVTAPETGSSTDRRISAPTRTGPAF